MGSKNRGWVCLQWFALFCVMCAWLPKRARAACETPNLVIVLDKSGSMGVGKPTNWSVAVSAINAFTTQFNGKLRFGLVTFSDKVSLDYGIDACVKDGLSLPAGKCVPNLQAVLKKIIPDGNTDLIGAIKRAAAHLQDIAKKDAVKKRKSSVLFITDGKSNCADKEVAALQTLLGAKTYVIGFGSGIDATCLNRMATQGGTALSGTRKYYQTGNRTELSKAMQSVVDAAVKETCNGLDDDCDGIIDNAVRTQQGTLSRVCSNACGQGFEVCTSGSWGKCNTKQTPRPEKCNNQDDDCDGKVDNGLTRECKTICGIGSESCQAGRWVGCDARRPEKEVCNDKDEDCNGKIDDDIPPRYCQNACGAGLQYCERGKWGKCSAANSKKESCNNQDDNCDGRIDEELSRPCKTKCGEGKEQCIRGIWSACVSPTSTQEVCDGKDNNCNGKVDEELNRPCKGDCGDGLQVCAAGRWSRCSTSNKSTELCNGKDDDCNGQIDDVRDNDPRCQACVNGICYRKCTQECSKGFFCLNGICRQQPCGRKRCGNNEICARGKCLEICLTITCPSGQVCLRGKCEVPTKDCYKDGCPAGELCRQGRCIPDKCAKIECPENREYCLEGKCVETCFNINCPKGEACRNGRCSPAPCGGTCPDNQVCYQNRCVLPSRHPCAGVTCPVGRYCVLGKCVDDPCNNVVCPERNTCYAGQCYGGTNPAPIPKWPGKRDESVGSDAGSDARDLGSTPDPGIQLPDTGTQKETVAIQEGEPPTGDCACVSASTTMPPSFGLFGLIWLLAWRRRRCARRGA